MNNEERKKGANRALNWFLLMGRNTPARLEQIVAKHLLLRVLNIVEYNNQNASSKVSLLRSLPNAYRFS